MKNLVFTLVIAALSGCAVTQIDPEKQRIAQAGVVTCIGEKDCEVKWAAARKWVTTNSPYRIRLITSDYLETFTPVGGSPSIGVRVSKEPSASGYRIVPNIWCDNMFGCVPDAWDALISFNKFVAEAK